jgi:hypothetical protein
MTTKLSKLAAALSEIKPVAKESRNPHFNKTYADLNTILAEVKPVLHKHGLYILQPIADGLVYTRIVDSETGEVLADSSLPLSLQGTPQQRGSEITYYRRYTLQSLLALEAEDDDANAATPQPAAPATRPAPPAGNDPDDNKPWIDGNNDRWLKAMEHVKGKGEEEVKKALAHLGRDFKINKTMREALRVTGLGLTAHAVNAD